MRFLRPAEITFKEIPWIASRSIAWFTDRAALDYYNELMNGGRQPEKAVLILPQHKVIYIAAPKAASTRIRRTLARVEGKFSRSLIRGKRSRFRGPYGPRNMTLSAFHRLATDRDTLRFSFVRNPYARAVSCWADKFASKPLVKGDFFIDSYLAARMEIDTRLPAGPSCTLSFPDFVHFVAAAEDAHKDNHIYPQSEILSLPQMELNFIGRVESFNADILHVLAHLGASGDVARDSTAGVNVSAHMNWRAYYTQELANLIYRVYEFDFDQFRYSRSVC